MHNATLSSCNLYINLINGKKMKGGNENNEFGKLPHEKQQRIIASVLFNCNFPRGEEVFLRLKAQELIENCTLKSLDIRFTLDSATMEHIATALQTNRTITKLTICDKAIEAGSTKELADLLNSKISIQEACKNKNWAALETLITNCNLVSLDLKSTELGLGHDGHASDDGIEALSRGLENNNTIKELNLRNNSISSTGAKRLAKALEKNSTITSLELSANEIKKEGAEAMLEVLESKTTITWLTIGGDGVRTEHFNRMNSALRYNAFETSKRNQLGDKVLLPLVESIEKKDEALLPLLVKSFAAKGGHPLSNTVDNLINNHNKVLEMDLVEDYNFAMRPGKILDNKSPLLLSDRTLSALQTLQEEELGKNLIQGKYGPPPYVLTEAEEALLQPLVDCVREAEKYTSGEALAKRNAERAAANNQLSGFVAKFVTDTIAKRHKEENPEQTAAPDLQSVIKTLLERTDDTAKQNLKQAYESEDKTAVEKLTARFSNEIAEGRRK
jgi:hypothetical protein